VDRSQAVDHAQAGARVTAGSRWARGTGVARVVDELSTPVAGGRVVANGEGDNIVGPIDPLYARAMSNRASDFLHIGPNNFSEMVQWVPVQADLTITTQLGIPRIHCSLQCVFIRGIAIRFTTTGGSVVRVGVVDGGVVPNAGVDLLDGVGLDLFAVGQLVHVGGRWNSRAILIDRLSPGDHRTVGVVGVQCDGSLSVSQRD